MSKKDFYTDRIIGSNRIIAIPTNNSISVNAVLFDWQFFIFELLLIGKVSKSCYDTIVGSDRHYRHFGRNAFACLESGERKGKIVQLCQPAETVGVGIFPIQGR